MTKNEQRAKRQKAFDYLIEKYCTIGLSLEIYGRLIQLAKLLGHDIDSAVIAYYAKH